MTALFGGSVEIELPAFCVRSSCSSQIELPTRWCSLPVKSLALSISIFKVLSICGQKKKGLALARPSAWLLFLALRTEPRSNPGGLAMRQPIGVNGCLARTGFGRTLAQADHRHLGGNRKVRGEH